jgi:hypothetical protein
LSAGLDNRRILGKITRSLSLPLSRRKSEQRHPVHGQSGHVATSFSSTLKERDFDFSS